MMLSLLSIILLRIEASPAAERQNLSAIQRIRGTDLVVATKALAGKTTTITGAPPSRRRLLEGGFDFMSMSMSGSYLYIDDDFTIVPTSTPVSSSSITTSTKHPLIAIAGALVAVIGSLLLTA
jgi:hypothetical protein